MRHLQGLTEFFYSATDQPFSTDRVLCLKATNAVEVDQLQATAIIKDIDALRRFAGRWRITGDSDFYSLNFTNSCVAERYQGSFYNARRQEKGEVADVFADMRA